MDEDKKIAIDFKYGILARPLSFLDLPEEFTAYNQITNIREKSSKFYHDSINAG